jgi:hypothetical protein
MLLHLSIISYPHAFVKVARRPKDDLRFKHTQLDHLKVSHVGGATISPLVSHIMQV